MIITLGEKGSIISDCGSIIKIPVFNTRAIDTTGGGAVYSAAFLVEYLRTNDWYKSRLYASAAASVLAEKSGCVKLSRMPKDRKANEKIMNFLGNWILNFYGYHIYYNILKNH